MSVAVGTIVAWIAITVFALLPKKLTLSETLLLFWVDTIFELSMFSILHVNLGFIVVEPGIGNGIADLMFRLIELPLLLVASSTLLLYSKTWLKWLGVAAIVLFTVAVQLLMIEIGAIRLHHWNLAYSGLYICAAIVFSRAMTWVITSVGRERCHSR